MYTYKGTKIDMLITDITGLGTDAIVNPASNTLLGGGGVDGAIHRMGGRLILEQCKKIGGCPTGEARITTAGHLLSRYIIHTAGPLYSGRKIDDELLYNSYYNSLLLAANYDIKSIAFPAISAGKYGFPIDKSVVIATRAIIDFLDINNGLSEIILVFNQIHYYSTYKNYLDSLLVS